MVAVLRKKSRPESEAASGASRLKEDEAFEGRDEKEAVHEGESFVVAKRLMCSLLALVYFVAFLSAYFQNRCLLGEHGLAPFRPHVERQHAAFEGDWKRGFANHPSLWWFIDRSDDNLARVAFFGMAVSAFIALGAHSSLCFLATWLSYWTIVAAGEGSTFYSYGWESQLLETGFLAIFLCSPLVPASRPTLPVLYLFRWLTFRISIGAGLIKTRGGSCWAAKTCLWYHFETQPVPSPLSFVFHFLPRETLSRGVDLDLVVQLYTSWMVLVPGFGAVGRGLRRLAGATQALFMVAIAASGNLSILNHLTVVPALACLDDGCFPRRFRGRRPPRTPRRWLRWAVDLALLSTIGFLSRPVVHNLLQTRGRGQVMNASFDPMRLVNTYGAFGSVGEKRYEPIISISSDGGWTWTELEFPCKPGDVRRRPCFSAPYHHRLDWNIWFIGFKPHQSMLRGREKWLYTYLAKLLDDDAGARALLDAKSRDDPKIWTGIKNKVIKVDIFHYEMADPLWRILATQPADRVWWTRTFEETLVPPMKLSSDGKLAFSMRPGLY